jgi:hypothetical protein
MWVKVVVIILMLAILFSLFRGLFFLTKGGEENSKKLLKSLAWRIGLSLLLFITVILLDYYGVINMREGVLPVDTEQQQVTPEQPSNEPDKP